MKSIEKYLEWRLKNNHKVWITSDSVVCWIVGFLDGVLFVVLCMIVSTILWLFLK